MSTDNQFQSMSLTELQIWLTERSVTFPLNKNRGWYENKARKWLTKNTNTNNSRGRSSVKRRKKTSEEAPSFSWSTDLEQQPKQIVRNRVSLNQPNRSAQTNAFGGTDSISHDPLAGHKSFGGPKPSRKTRASTANLCTQIFELIVLLVGMVACIVLLAFVVNVILTSSYWQSTIFCDTGSKTVASPRFPEDVECVECPAKATCEDGQATCDVTYRLVHEGTKWRCVKDEGVVKLTSALTSQALEIAAKQNGMFQCGESQMEIVPEAGMKDALVAYFGKSALLEHAYQDMLKETSAGWLGDGESDLIYSPEAGFSTKLTIKSWWCTFREWFWRNIVIILIGSTVAAYILYWYIRRLINKRYEREAAVVVSHIMRLLARGDSISQQGARDALNTGVSDNVWKIVRRKLRDDDGIQKSQRMIGGQQMSCWKLQMQARHGHA